MGKFYSINDKLVTQIFNALDAKDGKVDKTIQNTSADGKVTNIWNDFADKASGNHIKICIGESAARVSIAKYLSAGAGDALREYCGLVVEHASDDIEKQPVSTKSTPSKAAASSSVSRMEPVSELQAAEKITPVEKPQSAQKTTKITPKYRVRSYDEVHQMVDIVVKDYGYRNVDLNFWTNLVYNAAKDCDVEPESILAIIAIECGFNPTPRDSGSIGVMQVYKGGLDGILNDNKGNLFKKADEDLYNEVVYDNGKKRTKKELEDKIKEDHAFGIKVGILIYKAKERTVRNGKYAGGLNKTGVDRERKIQERIFFHYNGNSRPHSAYRSKKTGKTPADRRHSVGNRGTFSSDPRVAAQNKNLRALSNDDSIKKGYSYEAMRIYEILKSAVPEWKNVPAFDDYLVGV